MVVFSRRILLFLVSSHILFLGSVNCDLVLKLKQISIRNASEVERVTEFLPVFTVKNYDAYITVLSCEGEEPVEWVYIGLGSPSLVKEEVKVRKVGDRNLTSSELTFRPDGNYLKRLPFHTGLYTCRNAGNHSLNNSTYLFFPRKDGSFLLTQAGKKGSTLVMKRPEGNHTSAANGNGGNGTEGVLLHIPCLLTTPKVAISLYKRNEETKRLTYELLTQNVTYDPKKGFTLQFSSFENSLGQYKCSTAKGRKKDYAIFNVVEHREVKVHPNETMIFTSTILNLTCEADEPVHIALVAYARLEDSMYEDGDEEVDDGILEEMTTEPSDPNFEDDLIESETEETELAVHVANHVEGNNSVGDLGEFQCLADVDGSILHSWVYQIISPEADNRSVGISFNATTKSFACQTKTTSHGKLSFVLCETPSECRINKMCFHQYKNCRGYKRLPGVHCDWEKDCREIFHYSGTGFVHCDEDGFEEVLSFADLPGGIYFGNDLDSIPPSDGVLLKHEAELVQPGDTLRVYLKKWSYLFLSEHKWGIRFKNESLVNNPTFENQGSAKIEISDEVKAVEVLLTMRNGTAFTASLPIILKSS